MFSAGARAGQQPRVPAAVRGRGLGLGADEGVAGGGAPRQLPAQPRHLRHPAAHRGHPPRPRAGHRTDRGRRQDHGARGNLREVKLVIHLTVLNATVRYHRASALGSHPCPRPPEDVLPDLGDSAEAGQRRGGRAEREDRHRISVVRLGCGGHPGHQARYGEQVPEAGPLVLGSDPRAQSGDRDILHCAQERAQSQPRGGHRP